MVGILEDHPIPIPSMYGIYTYIWLIFMVNVGTVNIPYMDPMGFSKWLRNHDDRKSPKWGYGTPSKWPNFMAYK